MSIKIIVCWDVTRVSSVDRYCTKFQPAPKNNASLPKYAALPSITQIAMTEVNFGVRYCVVEFDGLGRVHGGPLGGLNGLDGAVHMADTVEFMTGAVQL